MEWIANETKKKDTEKCIFFSEFEFWINKQKTDYH